MLKIILNKNERGMFYFGFCFVKLLIKKINVISTTYKIKILKKYLIPKLSLCDFKNKTYYIKIKIQFDYTEIPKRS